MTLLLEQSGMECGVNIKQEKKIKERQASRGKATDRPPKETGVKSVE